MSTTKSSCQNCHEHIEHPEEMFGQTVDCPHCGQPTMLGIRAVHAPLPAPPPKADSPKAPKNPPAAKPTEQTEERRALQQARARSCYRTLRAFLELVRGLGFVLGLLMMLTGIMYLFLPSVPGISTRLVTTIGSILCGLVVIALAQITYQASVILIDIADLLIHQTVTPQK